MNFVPRPAQEAVLAYQGGRMGVSAVPGSGKTHVLSYLAAQLVSHNLHDDQEVLVVTFSNSAVDNYVQRITDIVRREGRNPRLELSYGHAVPQTVSVELMAADGTLIEIKPQSDSTIPINVELTGLTSDWLTGFWELRIRDYSPGTIGVVNSWAIAL